MYHLKIIIAVHIREIQSLNLSAKWKKSARVVDINFDIKDEKKKKKMIMMIMLLMMMMMIIINISDLRSHIFIPWYSLSNINDCTYYIINAVYIL